MSRPCHYFWYNRDATPLKTRTFRSLRVVSFFVSVTTFLYCKYAFFAWGKTQVKPSIRRFPIPQSSNREDRHQESYSLVQLRVGLVYHVLAHVANMTCSKVLFFICFVRCTDYQAPFRNKCPPNNVLFYPFAQRSAQNTCFFPMSLKLSSDRVITNWDDAWFSAKLTWQSPAAKSEQPGQPPLRVMFTHHL